MNMDIPALIIAIMGGCAFGTAIAFLIMALILNRSNNLGDTRAKDDSISTGINFTSQQTLNVFDVLKNTSYAEQNLAAIVQSEDYQKYRAGALSTDRTPVTRITSTYREK